MFHTPIHKLPLAHQQQTLADVIAQPEVVQQQINHRIVENTARRMVEMYHDSRYTAHERASDHAFSYDSGFGRRFWLAVCDEIRRIDPPKPKPRCPACGGTDHTNPTSARCPCSAISGM